MISDFGLIFLVENDGAVPQFVGVGSLGFVVKVRGQGVSLLHFDGHKFLVAVWGLLV